MNSPKGIVIGFIIVIAFLAGMAVHKTIHCSDITFAREIIEGLIVKTKCYEHGCSILVENDNSQRIWQWRNKQ